ncbi:hypothetical protein Vadar_024042 [Vaccinium darrowii]|uniref:Uncharacterized protein n=1 Tax=Vaccinium darrowii TaxID=229202 RepID=A0ACB7Z664_9ERIC|nr:hypothetical protein Vadar_024042 [Vaccinium darrowii]
MVILSLLLQILLIVLGNRRKHSCSTWVGVVIWAAYLLSDSVATFSLGIISTAQTNSASLADKSIKASEAVMVFWAPFLLVHLGGPDTITAYSLEDNELWLRHLIGLLVQAGLVIYLLVLSWIRSSINNNPLQLPLIAIPVLISGLLKYGERIWVLWSASSERFRKSLLRPAQAGPDYAKLMTELRTRMNMGHPLRYGPNEEPPRINRLPSDVIPEAVLLVTADQLSIFSSLFAQTSSLISKTTPMASRCWGIDHLKMPSK